MKIDLLHHNFHSKTRGVFRSSEIGFASAKFEIVLEKLLCNKSNNNHG